MHIVTHGSITVVANLNHVALLPCLHHAGQVFPLEWILKTYQNDFGGTYAWFETAELANPAVAAWLAPGPGNATRLFEWEQVPNVITV